MENRMNTQVCSSLLLVLFIASNTIFVFIHVLDDIHKLDLSQMRHFSPELQHELSACDASLQILPRKAGFVHSLRGLTLGSTALCTGPISLLHCKDSESPPKCNLFTSCIKASEQFSDYSKLKLHYDT